MSCCLTYDVPFGEFKRPVGVQTGKGDQVESLVHGVVHTHHTDIPATKETHNQYLPFGATCTYC